MRQSATIATHRSITVTNTETSHSKSDLHQDDNMVLESATAEGGLNFSASSWRAECQRMFIVLGWAMCGLAAMAGLAALLASFSETFLGDLGLGAPFIAVATGLLVLVGVVTVALRLTAREQVIAQTLLWSTAFVYAILINVFSASLNLGDAQLALGLSASIATAILALGGVVALVSTVFLAIGFDHPGKTPIRWGTSVVLVLVPIMLLAPGTWWIGILAGLLLAWATDALVLACLENSAVPTPALAACIAAGIATLALLVAFIVLRYVLSFVLLVVEVWTGA